MEKRNTKGQFTKGNKSGQMFTSDRLMKTKETQEERGWRYEAMAEIFDDLPDGAFFAAMEEEGFDIDDHVKYGAK